MEIEDSWRGSLSKGFTISDVPGRRTSRLIKDDVLKVTADFSFRKEFTSFQDAVDRLLAYHVLAPEAAAAEEISETKSTGNQLPSHYNERVLAVRDTLTHCDMEDSSELLNERLCCDLIAELCPEAADIVRKSTEGMKPVYSSSNQPSVSRASTPGSTTPTTPIARGATTQIDDESDDDIPIARKLQQHQSQ